MSTQRWGVRTTWLLLALAIIFFTFPMNDWSFGPGDDPPLMWVFNSLYSDGSDMAAHFVFPHGPLAFMLYPLPSNVLLVLAVMCLLKVLLLAGMWLLFHVDQLWVRALGAFSATYLIAMFSKMELLLIATTLTFLWLALVRKKTVYVAVALVLISISFFVKSYVAIITGSLFFSFLLVQFIRDRIWRPPFAYGLALILLIISLRFVLFGSLVGFSKQLTGLVHMAMDNSAAVALYPLVPWGYVVLTLIMTATTIMAARHKGAWHYALFIAPALFATWKHGMARADVFHEMGFLQFIALVLIIALVSWPRSAAIRLPLAVVALLSFYQVVRSSYNFQPFHWPTSGISNTMEFIGDLKGLKERSTQVSQQNIASNELPSAMRERIGNSTVDVYPWDLSIIPSNDLNWRPRVVIQSYVAYTAWLDQQNADHFASDNAPEFVVWHLTNGGLNLNGSSFNSIDGRYVLNDEPQTLGQLMSRYETVMKDDRFMLLQKRSSPAHLQEKRVSTSEVAWDEWSKVPTSQHPLRLKAFIPSSILRKVKSFFYKDEQFWILMRTSSGEVYKYRIVPKSSELGLLIDPLVVDPSRCAPVTAVRIACSNTSIIASTIQLAWSAWELPKDDGWPLFVCDTNTPTPALLNSELRSAEATDDFWSVGQEVHYNADHFTFSGEYSPTFELPLDSIPKGRLSVRFDAWVKVPEYTNDRSLSLVLDIPAAGAGKTWQAKVMDEQMLDPQEWSHVQQHVELGDEDVRKGMKAYMFNPNRLQVAIKDLRVIVTEN